MRSEDVEIHFQPNTFSDIIHTYTDLSPIISLSSISVSTLMPRLHVKYNYFKIISAFVNIHLK